MSNLGSDAFEVRLAGLDEIAHDHVVEAIAAAEAEGEAVDTDALVREGEALSEAHDRVEDLREAQEAAVADGDLETAHDLAFAGEWTMREVSDLDPDVADGILEAEADEAHLAEAADDGHVAEAAVLDAAASADAGMEGAAVVQAEIADNHAADAGDHVAAVTTASGDGDHHDWHQE